MASFQEDIFTLVASSSVDRGHGSASAASSGRHDGRLAADVIGAGASAMRLVRIWLIYLVRGLLGRRRFIGVTPPFLRRQWIFDRRQRRWLRFTIHDGDDWVQIEHIFLNEGFELSATGRADQMGALYGRILEQRGTPLIVDLGANIGLASRYFREVFPGAELVAVEPDAGNCAIARHNLPAGATLLEAAISSHGGQGRLVVTGRNCGFQVRPDADGTIPFTTVPDILDQAVGCIPFLIKIDIEGFEETLFASNTDWIDCFPILLIELHDWMLPRRRVARHFLSAMASREREFMHFDGYVVSLACAM